LIANGAKGISSSELPNLMAKLKKQEVVGSFKKDQMELF
jgi:hypothetical protein